MTMLNNPYLKAGRTEESTRRRWKQLRRQPVVVQVLLWVLLSPVVLLYLTPWEELSSWFRRASRRTQILVVLGASVIAFSVMSSGTSTGTADRLASPGPASAASPSAEDIGESEPGLESEPTPEREPVPTPDADAEGLYPERIDRQNRDQELRVGEVAVLDGIEAAVLDVSREGDVVSVTVALHNPEDRVRTYRVGDWRLQTPAGVVHDPSMRRAKVGTDLHSADLLPSGSAGGVVSFVVTAETGVFYIIWKPNSFSSARGIWGADLQ